MINDSPETPPSSGSTLHNPLSMETRMTNLETSLATLNASVSIQFKENQSIKSCLMELKHSQDAAQFKSASDMAEIRALIANLSPSSSSTTTPVTTHTSKPPPPQTDTTSYLHTHLTNTNLTLTQKLTSLQFPIFNGTGVHDWLFKAENFFTTMKIPQGEKVELASHHLDDLALSWFTNATKHKPLEEWEWTEFTHCLLLRFSSTHLDKPLMQLANLK